MRFLELRLLAFGGFEGLTLDFSAPGLHVIFGRNEAGKSTTLRAMSHVLYGIPERTLDAYKFPMTSLRIGARLEGADGSVLDVVRKKGRTKTLLDREDRAVDDAPLLKMLHGVSEEMFETSFGLTHDALQRGARALLEGGGDLGESLFQAGLGGGELHRLLASLREEADRIWSPSARTKPLNQVMQSIAEAKKLTLEKNVSHEAYEAQEEHMAEQRARKEAAAAERSQLLREQKRLVRLKGMLPQFAKEAELATRRAALGPIVVLPEGAPRDRSDALAAQADAAAKQQGQPQQGPSPKALAGAADEVRLAHNDMSDAQMNLTKAKEATTKSMSLDPATKSEAKAIEHLTSALKLLQPPPKQNEQKQDDKKQQDEQKKQDDKKQQEQQQQQQGGPGQRARDDDARRQKERQKQQRDSEPVDQDW